MKELPILMMCEMVCATLADLKTQTRRVVKMPPWITKRGIHPRMDEWMPGRYFHGSGQYHGGNSALTVDQPPSLLITCMDGTCQHLPCPYGVPGDRLWVREAWAAMDCIRDGVERDPPQCIGYRADKTARYFLDPDTATDCDTERWNWDHNSVRWRPSIFLPRWASRTNLAVTAVRVERVQEISEEDSLSEGGWSYASCPVHKNPIQSFAGLWDSIHAKPRPCYERIAGKRVIIGYESYPWEAVTEVRKHRGKPWFVCGNPCVWVVGFRRVP